MSSILERRFFILACAMFLNASVQAKSDAVVGERIQTALEKANAEFVFDGRPINPLGLLLFSPWLSDGPLPGSQAVYLEAIASDTNQFNAIYEKNSEGIVNVELTENRKPSGYFAYRHLGVLANGTHVVMTWENGGGTLVSTDLLLVSFATVSDYQDDGTQHFALVMKREGSFNLGDRFDGAIKVSPHEILIGANSDIHNRSEERTIKFK